MTRRRAGMIGGALALLAVCAAGAMAAALWRDAQMQDSVTARPGVRHAALHIGCPPGSHGTPRYAKFGQSLGYVRDEAGAAKLRDRGLTAAMPGRGQTNP